MTYSLASKIASKNKIDLIKWQYQLYDHTRKPYREIFITSSWTFTKIHVYIDMKPVLLTVDDEPQVLIAIEHDLKQRYGNRFRILQASTGQKGLAYLFGDAMSYLALCWSYSGPLFLEPYHFSSPNELLFISPLIDNTNCLH
jgi:hypothetical protein